MCGRATIVDPNGLEAISYEFSKKFNPADWRPRYNIRPTQELPVLRGSAERGCELAAIRWGLIPAWAKDPAAIHSTFNARGETVHEKPAFRSAFRKRRCLVLVDGFYEWPKKPSQDRNPRYFYMNGGGVFALAGVWERWTDARTGVGVDSCAIVTTEANALFQSVPHDRMPVILRRGDWDQWLDPEVTDAAAVQPLIRRFDHDALSLHVTDSQYVNYGVDDERCIAAIAA
jgi:putative SOS response-associated peptidase YedK